MNSRILTKNMRQIGIATSQFAAFSIITVGFVLENKPNAVEYFGAAMAIVILLQITNSKNAFADNLAAWEKDRLWNNLRYLKKRDEFRDEALDLTFDLHLIQIAQMCAELKLPCPLVDMNDEKLSENANDLQKRLDRKEKFIAEQELFTKKFLDSERQAEEAIEDSREWAGFFGKLEIVLGIWSTIQSAFGGEFVEFVHTHLLSA